MTYINIDKISRWSNWENPQQSLTTTPADRLAGDLYTRAGADVWQVLHDLIFSPRLLIGSSAAWVGENQKDQIIFDKQGKL